jgi:hypothetical protein
MFIRDLSAIIQQAQGEFIYLGMNKIYPDEALFSTAKALMRLSFIKKPVYLLTFSVWRKAVILHLLSNLEIISTLLSGISFALFDQTLSGAKKSNKHKMKIPFITIYLAEEKRGVV